MALYTAGGLFWAFLPFFVGLQTDKSGLTATQAGLFGSAYLGGFTLASVSALWWVVRLNWKVCVIAGVALIIAGFFTLGNISEFSGSALCCLGIGLAMGSFWVIAYRVFAASQNPDRSFGLAIAIAYSLLALITFVIGRYVIPVSGLLGMMTVVTLLVIALGALGLWVPKGIVQGPLAADASVREPVAPVLTALVGIFFFGLAFAAIWTFGERIGVSAGLDQRAVGVVLSSNLLVTGLGSLLAAALGNRYGRFTPLALSYVVLALCMIAVAYISSFAVFALAIGGLGFGVGFGMPFQLATVSSLDNSGRFVILITAAQGLGTAFGPFAGGMAVDQAGAAGAGWVGLAALIASFIAFAALRITSIPTRN
jgi:MFS family permease